MEQQIINKLISRFLDPSKKYIKINDPLTLTIVYNLFCNEEEIKNLVNRKEPDKIDDPLIYYYYGLYYTYIRYNEIKIAKYHSQAIDRGIVQSMHALGFHYECELKYDLMVK